MIDVIIPFLNTIFNPLLQMDPTPKNPILTVFVISFLVSLITTVANKYLVNQDEMNAIQKDMKKFQAELKEAQKSGDQKQMAKMQAKQVEMMQKQSQMMSQQFKPMIVTMVPILLVFWWMASSTVKNVVVTLPPLVYYCSLTPIWHFIGPLIPGYGAANPNALPWTIGWLLWYMLCTLGLSQILRKFMGFEQGF